MIKSGLRATGACALYALVFVSSAVEAETVSLKPSSQWVVNFADNSCRLGRGFGTGEEEVQILLSRYGPGDSFQFTIAGAPVKKLLYKGTSNDVKTTVRFGPHEEEQELDALTGNVGKMPALIYPAHMRVFKVADRPDYKFDDPRSYADIPPIAPERLGAIQSVTIAKNDKQVLELQLGGLQKPFAVMDQCIDGLVRSWGVDPEVEKQLKMRARPASDPGQWIKTSDYPIDMVRAGQPAVVQMRLDIDAEGKVFGCHILETTRPKEFDDAVCKSLSKRASFSPAIDANGNPVVSYWARTVRFALP